MSNIFDDRPIGESLSTVWAAKIARAPVDVFDTVDVLIKSFDNMHRFGPCRWTSPATDQNLSPASDSWHVIGAVGEPAFQNGWVNFGSGWGAARFRKTSAGMVVFEGLIKDGSADLMFTLPIGYRPAVKSIYPTDTGGATHGRIDVDSTGTVSRGAGSNVYITLTPISFYAGPDLNVSYDAALPQVGDPCIVTYDEQNRPYVIGWWPV